MKIILHYFKQCLASEFSYPIDFIGNFIMNVFIHVTRFMFLGALLEISSSLQGWDRRDLMSVFIITILMSCVIDMITPSIRSFIRLAHLGKLDPFLILPLDSRLIMFLRWMRPGNLFIFIVTFPFAIYGLYLLNVRPNITQISIALIALVAGVMINVIVMASWSLATILIKRDLPTEYIFRQVMRLNQLPPTFFGNKTIVGILLFIPIILSSTIPTMILVRSEYNLFFPFILALLLSSLIFILVFNMAMKKFNGFGG